MNMYLYQSRIFAFRGENQSLKHICPRISSICLDESTVHEEPRFCRHVSIVQCACLFWMHSSPSPPLHTGCLLILGREGMVVVVTVSGPLSCTSLMFDFIRAPSICRVRSEDVAELEDTWRKKGNVKKNQAQTFHDMLDHARSDCSPVFLVAQPSSAIMAT